MPTEGGLPSASPLVPQRLLEVSHVAHRLGVGMEYVRKLLRDRKLRGIRFGRRWRVDALDLQAFIEVHRVGSAGKRPPAAALAHPLHKKLEIVAGRQGFEPR